MNLRRAVVSVHLWIGLGASVVLLAASVTGALMVWMGEIERALNPHMHHVDASEPRRPLEESLAASRAAYPDGRVRGLVFPRGAEGPVSVAVGTTSGTTSVFVDPHTARVLGAHGQATGVMKIEAIHLTLLAGKTGGRIVAFVTLLGLFSALSGLYLWWPLQVFRPRWGAGGWRRDFDLHATIGFWTSALVVVITATGVVMAYNQWSRPLLQRLDGPRRAAAAPQSEPSSASPLRLDEVVERATAALPGARVANFALPAGAKAPWRVQMKFPEDKTPGGRSVVYLDQFTGKVLQVESAREAGLGTRLFLLQRSIHTGAVGGTPTQVLALVACMALMAQVVTGILVWWRRPGAPRRPGASTAA